MDYNSTDISYIVDNNKFNYRVCGLMIRDGRILAMHDERSPYYSISASSKYNSQELLCGITSLFKNAFQYFSS